MCRFFTCCRVGLSVIIALIFGSSYVSGQQANLPYPPAVERAKIQVAQLNEQLTKLDDRIAELRDLRERRLQQLDKLQVSEASFAKIMTTLQTERIQLLIDIAGLDARQKSVAQLHERALASPENKQVLNSIEKIVEQSRLQYQMARKTVNTGDGTSNQVATAKKELLEAELRLAEARQSVMNQNGFSKDELIHIAIEQAERKAKLKMVEELLKQFVESRSTITEITSLDARLEAEQLSRRTIRQWLREAERRLTEVKQ